MKKTKIILLILSMLLVACTFTACHTTMDDSQLREEGRFRVIFDCMGGQIGNYEERWQYAFPNDLLSEPGSTNKIAEPICAGHNFVGWFLGELFEDGHVEYGRQWDFATDRMPNNDFRLFAKWTVKPTVAIYYGEGFSQSTTITLENDGATINFPSREPTWAGHTLLGYYADKALTIPFNFPSKHSVNSGNKQVSIYTKWLDGEYTLVKTASDMANILPTKNYYLLNDIDFADSTWTMPTAPYRGIIEGNGYTISNINLSLIQASNYNFGLFSSLSGAKISNISFNNCHIEVKIGRSNDVYAGFLAGQISDTTLFNVRINPSPLSSFKLIRDGASAQNATVNFGNLGGFVNNDVTETDCDFGNLDYAEN